MTSQAVNAVSVRETLPHELINKHALQVIERLTAAGYTARLVGGGVRDLLLGREPKDFDVVTSALPEEVRGVFRNARLIGRRFRLAHVHFGREIIEVATYRGPAVADAAVLDENVFGTEIEDAYRRDFTVNALYYDVAADRLHDYVGGLEDLRRGILRTVGPPAVRFDEDPVRMLRAVRFAAKLGFRIEPEGEACLPRLAARLGDVPPARLFEEVLKLFQGGCALDTYELLRHHGLFAPLFPATEAALAAETGGFPDVVLPRALAGTDERVRQDKPITPAFLFAALLWAPYLRALEARCADGQEPAQAAQEAADQVFRAQQSQVSIPKRFSGPAREIWLLQPRFERRTGQQPFRFLEHKRFRAAFDFLLLRDQDAALAELGQWWTEFQGADADARAAMVRAVAPTPGSAKRRPRRRRRRGHG